MPVKSVLNETGVLITIVLIALPVILGAILVLVKSDHVIKNYRRSRELETLRRRYQSLLSALDRDRLALGQHIGDHEGIGEAGNHERSVLSEGLIERVASRSINPFIERKKRSQPRHDIDPQLNKLVLQFLMCAALWLLVGTTEGQYLGMKFSMPDLDHWSWLSFGRLRPVHTNTVFWGWASMGMLGLAHYVVPRISNTRLYSIRRGYHTLIAVNAAVLIGSILLMAGVNNGGGEYREYIWPVMILFGYGFNQLL
jgi:cytochrome c oxidase cbb3-type subunit 1